MSINSARRLLFIICIAVLVPITSFAETALDRYVAEPDEVYSWEVVKTLPGEGYTCYVLELTSQTWRSEKDVDRPVWTHWLTVIRPDELAHDTGFLYIGEGDNEDEAPSEAPERFAGIALATQTIVAEVRMVPNQPLSFADSPDQERYEDDLIAYSRVKYIVTGDEEWLVRLAMVKSAVRAMDAVQEFAASEAGGGSPVADFVVSGGSKRAWTTWLTPVVDDRVRAIIPIVIDALNIEVITRRQFDVYGFFSKAVGDYVRHGLYPDMLGTPKFQEILDIEDPYEYRGREALKLPKYLINASGDQFFLPDNSRFYFHDLPGEKYLRYVPNARHNLGGSDAGESVLSFYQAILNDVPRPDFSWELEQNGPITVRVEDKPDAVNLWQATNPDARDFRLDTIGSVWTSSPLQEQGDGVYVARVEKPEKGFTAYFVELIYHLGLAAPLKFTTDVNVIPDVYPYDLDEADEIELK